MRTTLIYAAVLVAVAVSRSCGADGGGAPTNFPALKGTDCIVFFGDSITDRGEWPGGWVALFREQILGRDDELADVRVIESGVGWDRVPNLRARFDKDVLRHNPSIVVIEIGINDLCEPTGADESAKRLFEFGLRDLIWRIKRAGARPVLCTLTVVNEKTDGNRYDELIDAYSDVVRELGAKKNLQVVELRRPFMDYIRRVNKDNRKNGILTVEDGAHLNDAGNRLLANLMLEAFQLPTVDAWWGPGEE